MRTTWRLQRSLRYTNNPTGTKHRAAQYGGLKVDQARRLKELEQENAKLKRLVSELSLEKLVLKDIASGNF
jgi:hypothetical protein